MNGMRMVILAFSGIAALAAGAWWLWPIVPADTPYFRWQQGGDDRYELVVHHVDGNPEFRQGVLTAPVPQSGALRVSGTAEPGALIEVSNPRTGRGYVATADADGAFAVEADARRGDELKVISRKIQFRRVGEPRYSSAIVSSP